MDEGLPETLMVCRTVDVIMQYWFLINFRNAK